MKDIVVYERPWYVKYMKINQNKNILCDSVHASVWFSDL